MWTGQPGYAIEPGGYVLLYSTDVTGAGKAHEGYDAGLQFDSGLSAKKGVRVQLFGGDGTSLDDFNYVTYSGTPAPAAYGRNADGVWYYLDATPGTVNTDGSCLRPRIIGHRPIIIKGDPEIPRSPFFISGTGPPWLRRGQSARRIRYVLDGGLADWGQSLGDGWRIGFRAFLLLLPPVVPDKS